MSGASRCAGWSSWDSAAALVLLVLIVIPWGMIRRRETFAPGQRYRVVGDLAFLLMVLPFMLAG